ncbi:hypothetical protein FB567DRAFT_41819 [Paraphoma chrysanthemicola]|uniref:Secreted protein n=1 Tax=Paraphoma chrysanthemicola TaxID=798071 RepID=A0A8K0RL89_9PLEO|nr:hypothetical protein FB567DRAFT_41819 [Paraphoma chrysanthemicola]
MHVCVHIFIVVVKVFVSANLAPVPSICLACWREANMPRPLPTRGHNSRAHERAWMRVDALCVSGAADSRDGETGALNAASAMVLSDELHTIGSLCGTCARVDDSDGGACVGGLGACYCVLCLRVSERE